MSKDNILWEMVVHENGRYSYTKRMRGDENFIYWFNRIFTNTDTDKIDRIEIRPIFDGGISEK